MLTLLISSVFYVVIISSGHLAAGAGHYVQGLMWAPASAAFLTVWLRRDGFASLGLGWSNGAFELTGYLVPLAYAAIAYAAVWAAGFGAFPDPQAIVALSKKLQWMLPSNWFVPVYFIFIGTTGMISNTAAALGEEIGWRGFLAPRLVGRMGFTAGALVTGLIWTAWHVPILLFADYNSGTPWWYGLSCFTVFVVSVSVMLTWLRLRSNSVWPCAILHASHNLFIQSFFTPLTTHKGNITAYMIDEFGLFTPVAALLFAFVFWFNRKSAIRGFDLEENGDVGFGRKASVVLVR
ncbi:MAG: type II CAAX endopeptidase family protein [Caulobacteraceae bacterium]